MESNLPGLNGPPADTKSSGVIRVLILDDQSLFRDGVANLLNSQPGIEIVGCSDTAAAAVETMIPPILLAVFFQRYVVRGLAMGAVQ